jgi:parallel beta-helix repeat protein
LEGSYVRAIFKRLTKQESSMKSVFFQIVLLIGCSLSWATTYYIDFTNGLNSNTGTSQTAAWKSCPGDAAAVQVPAQTSLKAGDIVIFKGGVIYKGEIAVKGSGSSEGMRIIYDGNAAGAWGTGKAVIDGENVRSYGFSATTGAPGYITIKNFEIMNMKYTGVPWQGGAAIKIDDASYVTIADCCLHDVGYWKNDGSIIPAGNGVHMLRPKNCLITGCEITRTGLAGIEVDGSVNCTFSRNNVHDYITWGIDIGGDFNLCTGNIVCDNTVHDLYQFDAGYWGIPNDPNIPHTDYIFLRMGGGQRPVKNIIERNLFYNNQVFHEFGGTAMVFLSYADTTIIRNNIFINPHGYYATRFSWTSSGTRFYNNTIYAPNLVTGNNGAGGIFLETSGNSDIRNNIIVTYQSSLSYTAVIDEAGLTSDYNLFYNATSQQDFVRITPARYATFAQWKTYGYDAHSIKTAAIADIGFADVAGYPTACQTMDLRVAATSQAVNAGITLTGFTCDKELTERPQGGAWDIGAYELNNTTPVVKTGRSAYKAEKNVPLFLTSMELRSLAGNSGYTIYTPAGKKIGVFQVKSNVIYLLRSQREQAARKIIVIEH